MQIAIQIMAESSSTVGLDSIRNHETIIGYTYLHSPPAMGSWNATESILNIPRGEDEEGGGLKGAYLRRILKYDRCPADYACKDPRCCGGPVT